MKAIHQCSTRRQPINLVCHARRGASKRPLNRIGVLPDPRYLASTWRQSSAAAAFSASKASTVICQSTLISVVTLYFWRKGKLRSDSSSYHLWRQSKRRTRIPQVEHK